MKFAWDARKEAANIAKHAVSFSEAQGAFEDPNAVVAFDGLHSVGRRDELRWWLLGRVGSRIMTVRYTHRAGGVIRIIGAGYWRKGKEVYEGKNPTSCKTRL